MVSLSLFLSNFGFAGLILLTILAIILMINNFQKKSLNILGRLSSTYNDIETVFLTASERHQFVASRFVKEIALLNGDISTFVPANVAQAIENKKK